MTPDTWLPTCTVVTADSVPVAVTVMVTVPRSTFSVRYCSFLLPLPLHAARAAIVSIVTKRLTLRTPSGHLTTRFIGR